jgi:excisionase family DNA binding protein
MTMTMTKTTTTATTAPADLADRWLTVAEVAAYTGIPVATLYTWRTRGGGPEGVKLGPRHLRYRLSAVLAWDAARVAETAA